MTEKFTRLGILGVILVASFCLPVWAADVSVVNSPFDQGFRLMYDLEFDQAHQFFSSWQREHPADPVSPAADAAGLLFSEFQRLGVLMPARSSLPIPAFAIALTSPSISRRAVQRCFCKRIPRIATHCLP